MPLTDAAPLLVAAEQGFFADEGLRVELHRQIGWGNVRDKLTFGQLDAAHALVGMPLLSGLGREPFAEPLVAVMNLGGGADAITLGRRLTDAGVATAADLAEWCRRRRAGDRWAGDRPVAGARVRVLGPPLPAAGVARRRRGGPGPGRAAVRGAAAAGRAAAGEGVPGRVLLRRAVQHAGRRRRRTGGWWP